MIIVIIISSIILASLSDTVSVYAVKHDTLIGDVVQGLVTNQNSGLFEVSGANGKTRQDTTSAVNLIHGLLGEGCNQPSGSLFPALGFEVRCKAIDKPGNVAIKSFKIKVQDRTPPAMEPCSFIFHISNMKETGYSFFFKIRTTLALKGIADCPSPPPPPPPVADAGKDFKISEAKIGHLDGSKSLTYEGGKLYYTWKQIGGIYSKLSNSHSPAPKFTAPKVDKDSKLKFELTVTNSRGVSTSDSVSVTVRNVITKSYDIIRSNIGGVHDGPGINFATAGDWGCNANTRQTMENIDSINPELLLALGDYSYSNTATCWLDIIKPLDSNTRIAIGNHEDESSESNKQYLNHFGLSKSYYSFEYGNIHVLVIDSEQDIDVGSSQYDFVRNDLQLASNDPSILWKLVIFHHPPYTSPTSCSACEPLNSLRDAVHPLFDKYGVDLVLMGHVHNYQRSFPLKYNGNDPSEPIITSSNVHNYLDPIGQIYTIVGTAGINFHALSGKESYIDYQQDSKFGFLNIHFSKDGKTMNSKFISNDGSVMDQFSIEKSQIQKNKKIDDKNPTADAGDDQKVQVSNEVKLDGSQSTDNDGKIVSFKWEQTDGPKVNLNSDQDKATFVVPDSATDSKLAFKLTVVDDKDASSSDDVIVQVEKVVENVPPTADAGDDQKVQVSNEVKLDGSQSTDNDGKIVSFKWEQTDGPKVNLNSDQDKATFVVPDSATDSKLAFKLTVVDDKDASSSDDVIVQVEKVVENVPPTADAGDDQKVQVSNEVKLDGSQSTDNDGKIVSFKWEQTDGPKVNLNSDQDKATFVVPDSATDSKLAFKLTVVDDKDASSSDDVIVQVEKVVENVPPTADAGDDQKVQVSNEVKLDGSQSTDNDGKIVSFKWEQTDGPKVNLNSDQDKATFVVPDSATDSKLAFKLTVVDDKDASSSDDVIVQVEKVVENVPPTADAGDDQKVQVSNEVKLDGSQSTDNDGKIVSFKWEQTDGPKVNLNSDQDKATFVVPDSATDSKLAFKLTVVDDKDASSSDDVIVQVEKVVENVPPTADAGDDQKVQVSNEVKLDGSQSTDNDGKIVSFKWEQTDGPKVNLNSDQDKATFVVPDSATDSKLAFKLTVVDDKDASSSDDVIVQVEKVVENVPPTADAGDDQKVQVSNEVKLDGSQSTDNDGKIVSFKWEQTDGPKVNLNSDQDKATFVVPDSATDSKLAFKLTVVDDKDASSSDDVIVQVEKVVENVPPTADAGDDQKVQVSNEVKLDGSQSTDNDGKIVSFKWEQTDGPKVNLNSDQDKATFVVPDSATDSKLAFKLTVVDDKDASSSDDVIVQVEKVVENVPPTAIDQKTSVDKNGQIDVALVGKDNHKGSIQFEIVSGPLDGRLVNLDEEKGIVTYIPKKDYTGDDEFRFRVTDNKRTASNIATVNVNVKEINQPLKTSENISIFKATLLQNGTNVHHDLILSSFTIDNGKLNILSSDYPNKVTFRLQQNLPINIVSKNGDSNVLVKDIILHDEENNPYHLKMNRDNNWIPNVPVGNYKIEVQGKYSQGNNNLVSFIDRVEILKNIKVN